MSYAIHIGPNIRKSPFFDATVDAGVRSFSVYNHMYIPGNFGDPEAEYKRLIEGVALWDVGAERQVELKGPDAARLAQFLTTRDLSTTKAGQGRYVPICDPDGYLVNDPVLLKHSEDRYWLSVADSDVALLAQGIAVAKGWDVQVFEPDASPLAIQGPKAAAVAEALLGDWVHDLKYFWFRPFDLKGIPLIVARSGWSKQGGFELYLLDYTKGTDLWAHVVEAGRPFGIGPGAPNDVERLESGLVSYGADCRRQSDPANPFEMGLGAFVHLERGDDFLGKEALLRLKSEGIARRRTGLFIDGADVGGNGHPLDLLYEGSVKGKLHEAAYSPRLDRMIGVGLVSNVVPGNSELEVDLGDGLRKVHQTPLPFI